MAEEMTATTTSTDTSQNAQNDSQNVQTETETSKSVETKKEPEKKQGASIEELIQKAVDRATNKLGNDNKKLRETLKEKMSAEELREMELREKEKDIADREAKLQEKIMREFAMKSIKEAGLDDGSANSLTLIDFVVCDDEEATLARVKAFGELVDKYVKAEVDKTFQKHGRNPNGSTTETASQSVPELLGKLNAERQKESNDILKHYLGGK